MGGFLMSNLFRAFLAFLLALGVAHGATTPNQLRYPTGIERTFQEPQEGVAVPTPGNSTTLLNTASSGTITHFWMTFADDAVKGLRLQFFYDGETTAKFDVQVGTFWQNYGTSDLTRQCWTDNWSSRYIFGGRHTYTERFPAPFASVVVKLYNPAGSGITGTYFSLLEWTPDATANFRLCSNQKDWEHSATKFSRLWSPPLASKLDFLNLPEGSAGWIGWIGIRGEGFGGTVNDNSWQECNIYIAIDGEASPSYKSTGTEDFFRRSYYADADIPGAGDPPLSFPWGCFVYRSADKMTSQYCLDMLNTRGGHRFNDGVHFWWDNDGVIDGNDCHVTFTCLYWLEVPAPKPPGNRWRVAASCSRGKARRLRERRPRRSGPSEMRPAS